MGDYRPSKKQIKKENARWKADKKREKERMKALRDHTLAERAATQDPYAPEHGHWVDRRQYEKARPYPAYNAPDEPIIVVSKTPRQAAQDIRNNAQDKFKHVKQKAIEVKNQQEQNRKNRRDSDNDDDDYDRREHSREYSREYSDSDNDDDDYERRQTSSSQSSSKSSKKWTSVEPVVDIAQMPGYWVVRAEMPGMVKEDVSVEVEGDVLYIKGKKNKKESKKHRSETHGGDQVTWYKNEREQGKYKRTVLLPEKIEDPYGIEAVLKFGVLEVLIPRSNVASSKSERQRFERSTSGQRVNVS